MVGAAMTWSIYAVGSRRLVTKYGPLPVTAWTLWVGTAGLVLWGIPSLVEAPLAQASPFAWMGVVYAGVLAIGLILAQPPLGILRSSADVRVLGYVTRGAGETDRQVSVSGGRFRETQSG